MKLSFSKTLLSMAILVGLTACGSGGGSGSTAPRTLSSSDAGAAYIAKTNNHGEITSVTHSIIKNKNDISFGENYISINGEKFPMPADAIQEAEHQFYQGLNAIKNATDLDIEDISGVGIYIVYDKGAAFYLGNPTKDMPISGSATYLGGTMLFENKEFLAPLKEGKTKLIADFSNKKLDGSLVFSDISPINISANIDQNNFTGRASSNSLSPGHVEGKFYGKNAASISGIVKSDDLQGNKGWIAIFSGADKKHFTPQGLRDLGIQE